MASQRFPSLLALAVAIPLSRPPTSRSRGGPGQAGNGHPVASQRFPPLLAVAFPTPPSHPVIDRELRDLIRQITWANPGFVTLACNIGVSRIIRARGESKPASELRC